MRIANLAGRLVLVTATQLAVDVESASGGRFGPDPQAVYDSWHAFTAWARSADAADGEPFSAADLGPPAPRPRQVLAIGLTTASTRRSRASGSRTPPPSCSPNGCRA